MSGTIYVLPVLVKALREVAKRFPNAYAADLPMKVMNKRDLRAPDLYIHGTHTVSRHASPSGVEEFFFGGISAIETLVQVDLHDDADGAIGIKSFHDALCGLGHDVDAEWSDVGIYAECTTGRYGEYGVFRLEITYHPDPDEHEPEDYEGKPDAEYEMPDLSKGCFRMHVDILDE